MKKIIFSALVAIVAMGGAFAGNAANSNFVIRPAAPFNNTTPGTCDEYEAPCNTSLTSNPVCTVSGSPQLYGKTGTSETGLCTTILYKDTQ